MRIGDIIYNLDGAPFRSIEFAERMRTLLSGETGVLYRLESHPDGYVLRRSEVQMKTREQATTIRTDLVNGTAAMPQAAPIKPNPAESKTRVYRPAVVRANVFRLPLLLVGILLATLSEYGTRKLLSTIHIAPGQFGEWPVSIATGLTIAGGFLTGGILLTFWTEWLSAAYTVSPTGIEARTGLVARDTVGLRYQDIRSVTLKQSLFERLVGIGTLEFASAGTDGRPVRFLDIARPGRVKALIEARMIRASED